MKSVSAQARPSRGCVLTLYGMLFAAWDGIHTTIQHAHRVPAVDGKFRLHQPHQTAPVAVGLSETKVHTYLSGSGPAAHRQCTVQMFFVLLTGTEVDADRHRYACAHACA